MNPLEYSPNDPASRPRSAPVRFLFRTNPFYLLSAMCMLGGCLALTNSLSWTSIPLPRLLALVLTLNVYEGLLLALGLYLLRRRGVVRDGLMLLFLEALFLVDAAFLNVEVFAIDAHVGLIVNAIIFVLAVVKLLAVFRVMRLPRDATFYFALVQLAVLFATPGVFAYVTHGDGGTLPPGLAYAAWWTLGLVAALPALALRGRRLNELLGEPADAGEFVAAVVRRSFAWLSFVSLVAHLALMHWVYDAHLHAAYLAPLLLGGTVTLSCAAPSKGMRVFDRVALQLILPLIAVTVSLDAPDSLRLSPLGHASRVALTPFAVTLAVAYVVYVCTFLPRYALRLIAGAVVAALAFAFGPTPARMAAAAQQWTQWAADAVAAFVSWVVPRTSTGWGLTAVGAAFGFLGLGAAVSLRKAPEPKDGA
jgi:hypothetical protein